MTEFKLALKEKTGSIKGKIHLIVWLVYWAATAILFFSNSGLVIGKGEDSPFWVWILYFGVIAFMALSVIYCFRKWLFEKAKTDEKTGKKKIGKFKAYHLIVFAALSTFSFFVVELINNSEKLAQMYWLYALMNILGGFIMIMILMAWFNSLRRASLTFMILAVCFAIVHYCVYLFKGEPFQLIDIFSIGTAMDVAGGYTFEFTRWVTVMVTASLCVIAIILHWDDKRWAFSIKSRILSRVGVFVFMIAGYYMYLNLSWNSAMLGITTDLWAPRETYEEVGTNMGFFCVAKFMRNDPPEGYSVAEVEKIEEEFKAEYDGKDLGEAGSSTKPVNIIAIMNEAWADYSVFDKFATNEEYMPFYNSMTENTIKGHTLVCISGGGTAKTEYEFLTGNSVKQYPGLVPYVSFYTHDQYSLVTTLEAQGYESAAMHPNKATNWKRDRAYELLNFDKFYSIDDFDPSAEKFRGMISDRANYEKIIEVIEEKEDPSQQFFLFDITMQNHGGYSSDNYPISIEAEGYTDDAWNRYLSLVKESDEALQYLIEYFEDYDEPTMIVMFGDHFPSQDSGVEEYLSGDKRDNLEVEEMQKYYQTPFFIWTNYDMESESDVITSTNLLGTLMLEKAGVKMTDFNRYQLAFMDEVKAYNHKGYVTADGKYVLWADADEDVKKKLLEYEYLQYNALVEYSKRTDSFFTIQEDNE